MTERQGRLASDFVEAFENRAVCVREPAWLKLATFATDRFGRPMPVTGNFSAVFRVTDGQSRHWAVKCFFRPGQDLESRYQAIARGLGSLKGSWKMSFQYAPRALCVAGQICPVLLMEWDEGQPLLDYVKAHLGQPDRLRQLASQLAQVTHDLEQQGFAHGDLQHGNIQVHSNGSLRLIDYDGFYVPGLAGRPPAEKGHLNYQHPGRSESHFGPAMDRFSAWVISLGLRALAEKPELWELLKQEGDECLLFKAEHFHRPEVLQQIIRQRHWSGPIQWIAQRFQEQCRARFEQVSPLDPLLEEPGLVVSRSGQLPLWMDPGRVSAPARSATARDVSGFWPAQGPPDGPVSDSLRKVERETDYALRKALAAIEPGGRVQLGGLVTRTRSALTLKRSCSLQGLGPAISRIISGGKAWGFKLVGPGPYELRDLTLSGRLLVESAQVKVVNCRLDGGIEVLGESQVKIEQTQLRGEVAVRAAQTSRLWMEDCRVSRSRDGISFEEQSSGVLLRCRVWGASDTGLRVSSSGPLLVRQSVFRKNQSDGLLVIGPSEKLRIEDSIFRGNGGSGLAVRAAARVQLRGCRVEQNSAFGVALGGGSKARLRRVKVSHNQDSGLIVSEQAQSRIELGRFCFNQGFGVFCYDQGRVWLRKCQISQNTHSGLVASERSRVHIEESRALENLKAGLTVSDRARVRSRTSLYRQNGSCGIFISGRGRISQLSDSIQKNGCGGLACDERAQVMLKNCYGPRNRGHGLWCAGFSRVRLQGGGFLRNEDLDYYATDSASVCFDQVSGFGADSAFFVFEANSKVRIEGKAYQQPASPQASSSPGPPPRANPSNPTKISNAARQFSAWLMLSTFALFVWSVCAHEERLSRYFFLSLLGWALLSAAKALRVRLEGESEWLLWSGVCGMLLMALFSS